MPALAMFTRHLRRQPVATVGGAQVSEKNAGFVINTGQATCQDILTLIRLVRDRVFQQTGVRLEPEVRLLGCTLEEP